MKIYFSPEHSGQLLTKKQEEKLINLYESKMEGRINNQLENENNQSANNKFDPEMGHGNHNQCIDNDITFVLNNVPMLIAKSEFTDTCENVAIKLKGEKYNTELLYASTNGKDFILRSIINAKYEGHELFSFYPYAINDEVIPLKIKHIYEYSNCIEAILVCEYQNSGQTFSFFDIDYAKNKHQYVIGEYYNFALSAVAYYAEIVPEEEQTFTLDEERIKKIKEKQTDKLIDSEYLEELTYSMHIGKLIYLLQLDEKYPDDADFCSPIASRVKKVSLMNREFYRMIISIYIDKQEDSVLSIPLVARSDFFDKKPSKDDLIRGNLWLQGRMIKK